MNRHHLTIEGVQPMTTDAEDAAKYWQGKEFKKFSVRAKRGAYFQTFYARARTAEGAIAAVKRNAIGIPPGAQFTARLAGPLELGCVRTEAPKTGNINALR